MIRSLLPLAVLVGFVTPLAVAAAPAKHRTAPAVDARLMTEFRASDTNRDGVLDRAEVAARTARMRAMNGSTSAADMKALGNVWFTRADANHDNKVTPAEMQAVFRATFREYDTNHNGRIEPAELAAAKARARAEATAAAGHQPASAGR